MSDFHTQVLSIDSMHCDTCVSRVTRVLGSVPGVRVHAVEIGSAHVLAEPSSEPAIREALEQAGFTLTGLRAQG